MQCLIEVNNARAKNMRLTTAESSGHLSGEQQAVLVVCCQLQRESGEGHVVIIQHLGGY